MSDPRPRRPVKDRRRLPVSPEFNYEAHRITHIRAPCMSPAVPNPTILFQTIESPHRHARIRAVIRGDEMPKARHYAAELEISKDGGTTVAAKRHKTISAKRDDDTNTFFSIRLGLVNHKWKVRYRVRADEADCQGTWTPGTSLVAIDAAAGWSIWYDPDDADVPPPVTGLTLDVDQHRAHMVWDLPDDPDNADIPDLRISHLWVELWKDSIGGTLIKRDRYHHGEKWSVRLSKPGTSTFHARVYTVSHTGKKSTAATTSATKNTPTTPSAPSVAFEKINKRWRAVVTATTVSATDNEIGSYQLVLVHKTTHVSPTAGDKRHHGRVDGDGTSDDLTEVFRAIPANHYVYVRERARDTEGRVSAFSGWTDAGQPSAAEDHDHATGEITKHGGASTPTGALRCDGTSYATASYAALFGEIGYTYGGSGANFNVPDFRGRHPIGVKSTGLNLGADEGAAEADRTTGHGHATDSTSTTPTNDATATQVPTENPAGTPNNDTTGENQGHTHAYGGDNTSGPSGTNSNMTAGGGTSYPTPAHTHSMTGFTDPRDVGHDHGHTHGSHGHSHNHGAAHNHGHSHGGHGHGHGHDAKTRPHKAVHFIIWT